MSIVSHVVSRGFHGKTCTLETGGKLAGSCQVIKIALYECHDLLTQNGNRKIVAEWGEQIGIPWRTVGESFGAISHWTLLSLLFRPFICLKTRILWSCHGNISLFLFSLFSLYQATRRTKGSRTVIVLLKIRWMDFYTFSILSKIWQSSFRFNSRKSDNGITRNVVRDYWNVFEHVLLLSFSEI